MDYLDILPDIKNQCVININKYNADEKEINLQRIEEHADNEEIKMFCLDRIQELDKCKRKELKMLNDAIDILKGFLCV